MNENPTPETEAVAKAMTADMKKGCSTADFGVHVIAIIRLCKKLERERDDLHGKLHRSMQLFGNMTLAYKKQTKVAESALSLIDFLDKNCGENSDWPVRILHDDDGAPVVPLLNNLRDAAKIFLANAEVSNGGTPFGSPSC